MKVSKLDGARRQLEVALRLFFLNGEPVSLHTLAAAADQVLHDLALHEGKAGLIDGMLETIKPDKRAEFCEVVREPQNFFKHAVKDPSDILEFNPDTTAYLLEDAILLYRALTSERVALLELFLVWFNIAHAPIIADAELRREATRLASQFDPSDRGTWLELLPEMERLLSPG